MPAHARLIAALRAGLRQRANPDKAPDMQKYMKSTMPYLGVQSTPLRECCHQVFSEFRLESFDDWRDTILALWHGAQFREERYAALELLGHRQSAHFRTLDALALYEELITTGAWWDLVDGIASHQVGDLVRAHPSEMRERLLAWSRGDDMWLRRTAIICQIGSKQRTDADLLFACIGPSLGSREFFLRKGIGWALREYAKTNPEAVRDYVRRHDAQLSGLSKREALKHIQPDLQSGAASG